MKLALIAPKVMLGTALAWSDYHMILPDLFEADKEYRKEYKKVRGFKILDNGAAEGKIYWTELAKMAAYLEADEVVLPDVMGDAARTLDFFKAYPAISPSIGHMAVVHGTSFEECRELIKHYADAEHVTTLGLPRILAKTLECRDARLLLLAEIFDSYDERFQIHLLGAHSWIDEVRFVAIAYPQVRGMDTSLPYVHGYYRNQIEPEGPYYPRPADYYTARYDAEQVLATMYNVGTMVGWASGNP